MQIADTKMVGLTLPARLSDFVRIQRAHRDEVSDQLAAEWTMKVNIYLNDRCDSPSLLYLPFVSPVGRDLVPFSDCCYSQFPNRHMPSVTSNPTGYIHRRDTLTGGGTGDPPSIRRWFGESKSNAAATCTVSIVFY